MTSRSPSARRVTAPTPIAVPGLLLGVLWLTGCQSTGAYCDNSCRFANDGECDDGRSGAVTGYCALGTDCNDCGPNMEAEPDPDPGGDGPTAPRDRCAWPGRVEGFGRVRVDDAGWVYARETGETGTLHRLDPTTGIFEPIPEVILAGGDYDVFAGDGGVYWADGELVRFGFDGSERWRVPTPQGAVLAVPGGETVVVGETSIRRFAADGTERWNEALDAGSLDGRNRADVNAAGQLAVLLHAEDGTAVLRRYGPDGARIGSDPVLMEGNPGSAIRPYSDGGGVALMADGDVAVVARSTEISESGELLLISVTRYALDGTIRWVSEIPEPPDFPSTRLISRVQYLRASRAGDLVLAGFASGTLGDGWGGDNDAFVMKLAGGDGSVRWTHQEGGSRFDAATDPVFTLSGNVIVRIRRDTSSGVESHLTKLDGDTGDETSGGPISPDPGSCSGPTEFTGSYGTPCTPAGGTFLWCEMVDGTAYLWRCDPDTCLFEGHACENPSAVCSGGSCVVREGP